MPKDGGDKKVNALAICDRMVGQSANDVVEAIVSELSITKANAYYYYSRVWKVSKGITETTRAPRVTKTTVTRRSATQDEEGAPPCTASIKIEDKKTIACGRRHSRDSWHRGEDTKTIYEWEQ